jgi:hypothetical protein
MPTTDPRLGLAKPVTSDDFDTDEIAQNWQKIANAPGAFICTSGTRPGSWSGANEGQFIIETDTGLLWRWNGSAFVRASAKGWLDTNRRSTDLTGVGTSFTTLAQVTVTVPDGGRSIRLTGSWSEISAAGSVALFRGATQLHSIKVPSGAGGSIVFVDVAPSSGSTTYALKVKATSGTLSVICSSTTPGSIDAEEV